MVKGSNVWFDKVLALLHRQTGVDFTNYKEATLRRRIERRMNARKIGSYDEYCAYLRKNQSEVKDLFNDILIPVTSFFRDPAVFKALKANYLPQLLRSIQPGEAIRVWVPACTTGEELYSLAIILAELKEAKNDLREVQIFGTDISEPSLERARAGLYPRSIAKEVSAERLRRFFEPVKNGFMIQKAIRDLCVFARHNLAVDPPFSNLDFISCRNALIYMTPALHSKILAMFHFALKPNGLLLLGPSESTDVASDRFAIGDRKINLFHPRVHRQKNLAPRVLPRVADRPSHVAARHTAAAHLKQLNPLQMREALERILQRNKSERETGESHVVPITIPGSGEKAYLVFGAPKAAAKEKINPAGKTKGGKTPGNLEVENAKLRQELYKIRKAVETIVEQQEATNEELRAANEEVVSSNEELQSTNEELETAKEELQASNEELATLNGELESRNDQLERANAISAHFKAIVESSDDAIISKDLNGIIRSWNRAAKKIYGYTADEAIGKPVTILFPPEALDDEPRILGRIRSGERIDHYETVRVRKDGKLIDISLTVSPIKNGAGQVIGASKIARDITEKKRAEILAKYFEAIVASSDDAIISKDLNGIIQTWNRGAEKVFGYTANEVIGKPVTILFPPDAVDDEPRILAQIRAGQRIEHFETVRVRKDGRLINVSLTVSPIKNSAGQVIGASKIARDITERKRAEILAKYFEALVASSDDAIISKDLNGIIQTWNRGAEKIFGYTANEVIGKPVTILFPPEALDDEPRILARIRAGESIDHYETVRVRKGGRLIDVSLTVSPIKDDAGRIVGASKIVRDISEQKRTERELREARDEAERASRAKDDFLAAVSHELRTPLNPVLLLASDAAADPDLAPGIRANFDTILKNVELEAKLIDDLLDLARVRAGKLKVEKRYANVHSVLTSTLAVVQSEIDQKRITLKQKFDDTQSVILGDTVRLQQIFWNILKNAIKFTPAKGTIAIETSATRENCVVKISDSGMGMSRDELARAFDAFKQGDHSTASHRFGGLGLGLTITKNLVELHSGTIEAFSDGRGKGSCFTITLPLAKWNENNERKILSKGRINHQEKSLTLQILLVDDHEATRSALAKLLANRNHKVTMAGTVGEAMNVCKNAHFDLVISDIGLPDGSGYDLFESIRRKSPDAKGIALTGYGMEKDLARSKECGFSAHLTKPVKVEALDTALAGVFK